MADLSVLILTQDEEKNLPDLLDSIAGLGADLFVMDSGSTDRTVAIAEAAGATVFTHPFDDASGQRNRAQALLPNQEGWVLHLDADERLTPELRDEIATTMASSPGFDGFMLRQRTVFMGRWIKHGGHYPSYHLRLFKIAKGRCEDRRYDQHYMVDGRVGALKNDYIDVIGSDLETWTIRHAHWAKLEVDEQERDASASSGQVQPRWRGTPIERRRWLRVNVLNRSALFGRSFGYWFYRYFLRLGFLDGKEGFIFHFLQGCWYQFLVGATKYEREKMRAAKGIGRADP